LKLQSVDRRVADFKVTASSFADVGGLTRVDNNRLRDSKISTALRGALLQLRQVSSQAASAEIPRYEQRPNKTFELTSSGGLPPYTLQIDVSVSQSRDTRRLPT
jgi:hypothetical protein